MIKSAVKFIHNYYLLMVVFLTGGAILILEVVATRVLSAYFGNTIYTVSSVISVILFALSTGYYTGGKLADKKDLESLFYKIILVSGMSVWIIYLLNIFIIPKISNHLSLRDGPLFISLLLFFLPSYLLGILSPMALTMQNKKNKEGIGQTAGNVFFWSTLGSIAGSLSCGFYLIPNFGIDMILIGVGVILVIIAMTGLNLINKINFSNKIIFLIIFIFPLFLTFLIMITKVMNNNEHVFTTDGIYSKITIYDSNFRGRQARFMQQDIDRSSAIYFDTNEPVYDYAKYYKLYKLVNPHIKNALVIGGGGYSVPKALLQEGDQNINVDVVDIEPILPEIAKKYFGLKDDKRLKTYVEDGRRFLNDNSKKYDLIYTDAFSFTIPPHLTTREFFQLSKSRLKPGGLFIMNTYGTTLETSPSFALSEMRTFRGVYPNSYFFAVISPLLKKNIQNIMIVGYNSEKQIDFSQTIYNSDPFLQTISYQLMNINKYKWSDHIIFTDNYAPTEYYMAKTL